MSLKQELHKLEPDARVELFTLDATALGAGVYRFTTTKTETALVFRGQSYPFAPVEISGFEISAQGSLPTPSVSVGIVGTVFQGLVIQYDDLLGATLTRERTFARFLDNGSTPDSNAVLAPDIYRIEQKTAHVPGETITWQLSAVLDQQGVQIPRRRFLRSTCLHTYRVWNGSAFVYTSATCPYAGTSYFRADGTATATAAQDVCGKRLSDCKARFGAAATLPTRAFPGIALVRV